MSRIITLTLEVSDQEFAAFLGRINSGVPTSAGQPANVADDDGPADATAPAVDVKGVPWIEAVHSANKTRNDDGTWRGKRGVDSAKRAAAEAEALAKMQATIPAAPAGTPQFLVPPGVPVQPDVIMPPTIPGMPAAAAPVAIPGFTPPPAAPVDVPVSVEQLTTEANRLMGIGKLDQNSMVALYAKIGLVGPDVAQIMTNESKRQELMREFKALG